MNDLDIDLERIGQEGVVTVHANGIQEWPTLYKKAKGGKEQQWTIDVVPVVGGDRQPATIRVRHGQVGGKIQQACVRIDRGKNLGKSNETSPLQQAVSEADAKWLKQKDKGYSEERGGASLEYKPMLAHKYEDVREKVVFPALVQPKLDGIRAIAVCKGWGVTLLSRQGKEHKGLAHIRKALARIMKHDEVWDGELYVHGMPFQTLVSLVKKDQPESVKVQYHVYDRVEDGPFIDRSMAIAVALDPQGTETFGIEPDPCLVQVPTLNVQSYEDVEAYHERFVSQGYEGAMLRVGDCTYTQGYRSRQLLKVKAFKEDEFRIVDVVPGVGKMADQGIFVCETGMGVRFNARPRGRDDMRREYLANKGSYIGKMLTVTYFSLTDGPRPVPRFPVGKAVREYE